MNIQVLRSSSSGNSTVIWHNNRGVLIDGGISVSILNQFLSSNPISIKALIITHAHNDHLTNAICNFCIKNSIEIFLPNKMVFGYFSRRLNALLKPDVKISYYSNKEFYADGFHIIPFELAHDSVGGCFGFNIFHNNKKISYATDFVNISKSLENYFLDSDTIIIESNHDIDLLNKSNRPFMLKKRISEKAHISNVKCSDFLVNILDKSEKCPKNIFLAHISSECNRRELALSNTKNALLGADMPNIRVELTYNDRMSEICSC